MDKRLPWFRAMSAENRSWLGLVAQAGIAAFVDWVRHPERTRPAVAGEVFGTAPRELARAVSLQQAVEMVRVIIDVVESQVDELAAPGGEAELREAVLRYTREVAFGAAQVYARTAEARGAWDARLEALVVGSLVRGETEESMNSWASALSWKSSPVAVIAGQLDVRPGGQADGEESGALIDDLRTDAKRARLDVLAGVQGSRLIVVLGGTDDPISAAERFACGPGPGRWWWGRWCRTFVRPPHPRAPRCPACVRRSPGRTHPARSARMNCCPSGPWPGDPDARSFLISGVYEPLLAGGSALVDTLTTYLEQGSSLEATARMLFVHPNTVRYRLRRVTELTGYAPSDGRDGFSLWIAIVLGRLAAG